MDSSTLQKYVSALKERQSEIAEGAMERPASDLVGYGVQAGRYQGVQLALDTLDSILRDAYEKENK